jgi:hypothetical protein
MIGDFDKQPVHPPAGANEFAAGNSQSPPARTRRPGGVRRPKTPARPQQGIPNHLITSYTRGCAGGTAMRVNDAFDAVKARVVAGTAVVRAGDGFDRVRGGPPGGGEGSLHAARHPLQTRSAAAAPEAG